MRRDDTVFVMGEEVAATIRALHGVTQGLLQEFGVGAWIDTPITEHGYPPGRCARPSQD